jgi:hypothetical protein
MLDEHFFFFPAEGRDSGRQIRHATDRVASKDILLYFFTEERKLQQHRISETCLTVLLYFTRVATNRFTKRK